MVGLGIFVVELRILGWWAWEGGGIRKFMVMVFEYLTEKIGMAQYLAKIIIRKISKSGDRIWENGKNYEPEKSAKIL